MPSDIRDALDVDATPAHIDPADRAAPSLTIDALSVVLIDLGQQQSAGIRTALQCAGANVRTTFDLADARCRAVTPGPSATVIVAPATIPTTLCGNLRSLSDQGVVLLLSVSATRQERIALLNSGADCVLPTVDPDEVVAALSATLRRSDARVMEPLSTVLSAGEIRVDMFTRTASVRGRRLTLTPLEFELLAYFVTHHGEALSRDRLLKNVWGYEIGGHDTITVHIRRLRMKLEADPSQPTQLQTVRGFGYRLDPLPSP